MGSACHHLQNVKMLARIQILRVVYDYEVSQGLHTRLKISLRLICGVDFEVGVVAAEDSSGSCCPYLEENAAHYLYE